MEIKLKTDDLVSVAQAARSLSCARLTIYRWVKGGKIVGIKLSGLLFIPKTEIERLQKQRAPAETTEAPN